MRLHVVEHHPGDVPVHGVLTEIDITAIGDLQPQPLRTERGREWHRFQRGVRRQDGDVAVEQRAAPEHEIDVAIEPGLAGQG